MNLDELLHNENLSRDEIVYLLNLERREEISQLFQRADEVRKKFCGDEIHLRGVIEFSNYCSCNCLYCGLREDNFSIERFRMTADEIIGTAKLIYSHGIRTIVLQSGEDTIYDTDLISFIIYSIKKEFDIAITLSLGQRGFQEYQSWKYAGADRYLLKHETANEKLYEKYRDNLKLADRLNHLRYLKKLGYQVGSGNMIGMPLQTVEDIADDILFCKELDVDMAAICPFIPAPFTPYQNRKHGDALLTLKSMAAARIVLKDVHIPATTALDSIEEDGREQGLKVGANVIMPNFTPMPYREKYTIYPGKRGIHDEPKAAFASLQKRVEALGRKISVSKGDSPKLTSE